MNRIIFIIIPPEMCGYFWKGSVSQFSHSIMSTLCDPMDCTMPGFPVHQGNSWSLLKLMSTESVMPSNHLILCCPLLLPSIFPSIRVFSNESALPIRWPKYWSFTFSNSPFSEYSGLISFRISWFELFAFSSVQFSSVQSLSCI